MPKTTLLRKRQVSIGSIQTHASGNIPDGWIACDGDAISRTDYAELFLALGTTYGAGDGSTTFNLPDLRGEFIRGVDDMGTAAGARGVDAGRTLGSAQSEGTAANGLSQSPHYHLDGNDYQGFGVYGAEDAGVASNRSAQGGVFTANTKPKTSSVAPAISSSDPETRPRNFAMLYIIRAK